MEKIKSIQMGTRRFAGTDFPVCYTVYDNNGRYLLSGPICNGICDGEATEYATAEEALTELAKLETLAVGPID